MKTRIAAVALAAGALALGTALPAHADQGWVSLVYSNAQGKVYWVHGPVSQATADEEAMNDCTKTGATDCQVAASSADCAAVAVNGDSWKGGTGSTAQAATANAVANLGQQPTDSKAHCSSDAQ